jgi:hypothetical protein
VTADFESIATVTVGSGGSSSISFTSIPGTFTHLQLRFIARTSRDTTNDWAEIRFNSDTGSNYVFHIMYGEGGNSFSAYNGLTKTYAEVPSMTADGASANMFGAFVLDILDYKNTNKFKTLKFLGGNDMNGSGVINFGSGLWRSTSAITSIGIEPGIGTNFNQYSHFALYGIRSA